MPAKNFLCSDGETTVAIEDCLKDKGCVMEQRCSTRPYLRAIAYDREWKGVSPSSAGSGPRYLYLKATSDYTVDPNGRVFAVLGMGTHDKLSLQKYTYNVLAEEKLSDEIMNGIADEIEEDEYCDGYHILTDYKTWGSFKVAKSLGITTIDVPVRENGEVVLLKSGKNKGKPKTKKKKKFDPTTIDLKAEELQLNRYRIFFQRAGFSISKMHIQVVSRDGNTIVAKNRGIDRNLYVIPVKRLKDEEVLKFYLILQDEVNDAFSFGRIRKCNDWESWNGRRCDGYCEVSDQCKQMDERRQA